MLETKVKTRLNKVFHSTKKNAQVKGIKHTITKDYLETLFIGCQGFCPITGIKLETATGSIAVRNPKGISVDRIDSAKGYEPGNVRIVSTWYNNAKGAWDDDFVQLMAKRMIERLG
jgi:hypothetical protein